MKQIIKVNANSYNDFTVKLYLMKVNVKTIKTSANGKRIIFYDNKDNIVAEYNESKIYGKVYNYDTHSNLTNKVLSFKA